MYKRQQNKRKRNYAVKRTGIKDENIDRQITVIHKAIGLKLLAFNASGDNSLMDRVLASMEQRRDEGRMGYGEYLTWLSLLEIIEREDEFLAGMIEDSPRMRKLRRRTPFIGILTEEERQSALDADAIGELEDISNLFS